MHRFFILPENIQGQSFQITGPDVKHVTRVLRLGVGDRLIVLDGQGGSFLGEIEDIAKDVTGRILADVSSAPEMPVAVTLACALIKGEKMDWVIQKATELGVSKIQPIVTSRCVAQPKAEKVERWQKIAQEAAEQSERLFVPKVLAPIGIDKLTLPLYVCAERGGDPLPQVFTNCEHSSLTVAVGPEGGFTEEEFSRFEALGAHFISLGPRILRAETAALAVLSALLYRFGL